MPPFRQRPTEQEPSQRGSHASGQTYDSEMPDEGDVRVLLLDDDPAIGRAVRLIVQAAGMDCVSVTREAEFFEAVESWRPTHVLLDLMMPGMDGVEVMSSLAQRGCDAYVILISGIGTQLLDAAKRAARANGLNVTGTVAKPFSAARLVKALRDGSREGAVVNRGNSDTGPVVGSQDLLTALQRNEFFLVYQPKIRCDSLELMGFEVLLRWQHPRHGLISPDHFIPIAEESGRILAITRLVFEKALQWLSGNTRLSTTLSINVSARCLHDIDFTDHLVGLCGHFGIDPERLVIELTETAATDDPVGALNVLTRLRLRGIALAIDDFGTGYSSMAQLAQLPFSEIKIDKSFVMAADGSARARSIIQSTIDLGRQLDMQVTAEGVETRETLDYLCRLGCDYAQGFLIARPLDADMALEWTPPRDAGSVTCRPLPSRDN